MKTFHSPRKLIKWRGPHTDSIGFVPTMGALHQGHLSLVEKSLQENSVTVVSVFVNPTQFNDTSDFENYPSLIEKDLALLEKAGVDVVFCPTEKDIYPHGYRYKVSETEVSAILEGEHRPGHFDGMLTIVLKLLCLVRPTVAYFGEKDYQQLKLVEAMAADFFLETKVVGMPVVREPSGLAMSSRNEKLSTVQRQKAAEIYQHLLKPESPTKISDQLSKLGYKVDYVTDWNDRRLAAVTLGDVRLIDNVPKPIS